MTEPSVLHPATDDCLVFPVEAPPHAGLRDDFSAVEFMEQVRLVQNHWVRPGEPPDSRSPGLHHNVSHTCTVRAGEWDEIAGYLWRHRAEFSGVALLPDDATSRYPQAPLQAATEDAAPFWNSLACRAVDYHGAGPVRPTGNPALEESCTAGLCDAP